MKIYIAREVAGSIWINVEFAVTATKEVSGRHHFCSGGLNLTVILTPSRATPPPCLLLSFLQRNKSSTKISLSLILWSILVSFMAKILTFSFFTSNRISSIFAMRLFTFDDANGQTFSSPRRANIRPLNGIFIDTTRFERLWQKDSFVWKKFQEFRTLLHEFKEVSMSMNFVDLRMQGHFKFLQLW